MGKQSSKQQIQPTKQPPPMQQITKQQNRHPKTKSKLIESLFVKIVVVGETMVGKSTIIELFSKNNFRTQYRPTTGIDFYLKDIKIDGFYLHQFAKDPLIRLQIWDTAGQVQLRSNFPQTLNYAGGIIMVYELNNYASFEKIREYWLPLAKQNVPDAKIFLLGHNIHNERVVSKEEAEKLAKENSIFFHEVDAKEGENTVNILTNFAWEIIKTRVKIFAWKEAYMHLLLQINEDFDDDMLQDTLEILVNL